MGNTGARAFPVLAIFLLIMCTNVANAEPTEQPTSLLRWFNLLKYQPDANITYKLEATTYAIDKCKQYISRFTTGQDLGLGDFDVINVFDFPNPADFRTIFAFDKCIDANNPTPHAIADQLVGTADVAMLVNKKGPNDDSGFSAGAVRQLTMYKVTNYTQNAVAQQFSRTLSQSFGPGRCLLISQKSGADATPFKQYSHLSYAGFEGVYQMRAFQALLTGQPGPPLPGYQAVLSALSAPPAMVQFVAGPTVLGGNL